MGRPSGLHLPTIQAKFWRSRNAVWVRSITRDIADGFEPAKRGNTGSVCAQTSSWLRATDEGFRPDQSEGRLRHRAHWPDRARKELLSRIAKASLIRGQKLEPPQNRFFSKTASYLCSNGKAPKLRLKITGLKQRPHCQLQPCFRLR